MTAILTYLAARLREPSTWRGLVLIGTVAGIHLTDAQVDSVVQIGLFLAGLLGAALPDAAAKPAA